MVPKASLISDSIEEQGQEEGGARPGSFPLEALQDPGAVDDLNSSCSLGILIRPVGWKGDFQTPGRWVPVNRRKVH